VRHDHAVEVVDRGNAEPDLRHRSELVQGDRLARAGALQALHGVLVSARDAVEHRDEITCLRIGFLDRGGEQRPRKGAFLDMGALGEPRQPGCVLRVERDVQPMARFLHENQRTARTSTKRVPISHSSGCTGDRELSEAVTWRYSQAMSHSGEDDWVLDDAEALLDMDGRRERLEQVVAALQNSEIQPVDHATARDQIEKRIRDRRTP